MPYGQNLPWRAAALVHATPPAARLSFSRATPSLSPQRCAAHRLRFQRRLPSPPAALLASRSFSVSLARSKEKPKTPPAPPSEGAKDESKEERPKRNEVQETENPKTDTPEPIPSQKAGTARGSAAPAGSSGDSANGGAGNGGPKRKEVDRSLPTPASPKVYPQVMAITISRRPLFPGYYKSLTIHSRDVADAITELYRRGQPYIGLFTAKGENDKDYVTKDVINDPSEVYDVGTFCQITSVYPGGNVQGAVLTVIVYVHRRIKMTDLKPPPADTDQDAAQDKVSVAESTLGEEVRKEAEADPSQGDIVASFEETAADVQKKPESSEVTSLLRGKKVSIASVENLVEEPFDVKTNKTIPALVEETVRTFNDLARMKPQFRDQLIGVTMPEDAGQNPARLADLAAIATQADLQDLQDVLSELNVEQRLTKALTLLKKELINAQLQVKLREDLDEKILKLHRDFQLKEQLKIIRRELGDSRDGIINQFKEKASKLAMPPAAKKAFEEELNKLSYVESSELNVTRTYLETLTQLPWGQKSTENFSIKHATEVLDEDHYGMKDVKDRILESIAVGKLRGTVEGKILCLVGPPGVGKTSIGKSVARAMNRKYYRLSMGGVSDPSEIKGHRRTYVGALPGRIIQALKQCQTENPLILIDEVDKIGRGGIHGDPTAVLLELLDPAQNHSFMDHYLDVPVDLSNVLFVCTANLTDTIPAPLLDRMEVIELSGYVADEKLAIAERYLIPAARETNGLKEADVVLEKDAIVELIHKYCRESGVRNLKKQIEKVYRKSALKIVTDLGEEGLPESEALTDEGKAAQEESEKNKTDMKEGAAEMESETAVKPRVALKVPDTVHVSIGTDQLKDYVGPPVYTSDRLYEHTPPGVTMGLAWTAMGGVPLYVESILENALSSQSSPGLERTGSLKSVMKESATVAYSFAKGLIAKQFPKNRFFEHARIHLHCPEGAVPKDGPSAGITMATSLLSLALDKPVKTTIAMTGELTVTGKVLRIGGLREKTVAAKRAGASLIIFPQENMAEWLELPQTIREGIEGRPVSWYHEVFESVFPDLDGEAANKLWEKELKKKGDKKKHKEKAKKDEDEESGDEDD